MSIQKVTGFTLIEQNNGVETQTVKGFTPEIEGGEQTPGYLEQIIQSWDTRVAQGNKTLSDYEEGKLEGNTGFDFLDKGIAKAQRAVQVVGKVGGGTIFLM